MEIEEDFAALRATLEQFSADCKTMRTQVRDLYKRTRDEEADILRMPVEPHRALADWWGERGPLTMRGFLVELFAAAEGMDIPGRKLRLGPAEAALFDGRAELSIYDVMAGLPRLFR